MLVHLMVNTHLKKTFLSIQPSSIPTSQKLTNNRPTAAESWTPCHWTLVTASSRVGLVTWSPPASYPF